MMHVIYVIKYYVGCYECEIGICMVCDNYIYICYDMICSIHCMYEYIRQDIQRIHSIFNAIINKEEGHDIFYRLVNDQTDQLSLIEVANKKRNCWTKMFLIRYIIGDLANIILEY